MRSFTLAPLGFRMTKAVGKFIQRSESNSNLMSRAPILLALSLLALTPTASFAADADYPPHVDSQVQPGVPKGEQIKFEFAGSKIFPGTTREVIIYVPKQYDGAKPACLYVNQDGLQWNAP